MMASTGAQKVIVNFGNFLKKICHKDFPQIAQSGHTDHYLFTNIFNYTKFDLFK